MIRNKRDQKGVVHLVALLIIFAGIAVVVYLANQSQVFRKSEAARIPTLVPEFPAKEVTAEVPAIENEADLKNTLDELENTNVDEVTDMLFENDQDASGF